MMKWERYPDNPKNGKGTIQVGYNANSDNDLMGIAYAYFFGAFSETTGWHSGHSMVYWENHKCYNANFLADTHQPLFTDVVGNSRPDNPSSMFAAVFWLFKYTEYCMSDQNKRAYFEYNYVVGPQIDKAIADFYAQISDPTRPKPGNDANDNLNNPGAYYVKDVSPNLIIDLLPPKPGCQGSDCFVGLPWRQVSDLDIQSSYQTWIKWIRAIYTNTPDALVVPILRFGWNTLDISFYDHPQDFAGDYLWDAVEYGTPPNPEKYWPRYKFNCDSPQSIYVANCQSAHYR